MNRVTIEFNGADDAKDFFRSLSQLDSEIQTKAETFTTLAVLTTTLKRSSAISLDKADESKPRFYVGGISEGKTLFWTYGLPSWYWFQRKPDSRSLKSYSEAMEIAENLRGKSANHPRAIAGPKIETTFLCLEG